MAVRSKGAPDKRLWNDHLNGTNHILWEKSIVPYLMHDNVEEGLKKLINAAIHDFNTMTPVQWIETQKYHKDFVVFRQNNDECPYSSAIGKSQSFGKQDISLPFPKYPKCSYLTQKICVMHEMMHVLGFHHEQARDDETYHCKSNDHADYSHKTVKFGAYDYKSIMHYRDGVGFTAKNKELHCLADNSKTFSQGDLAQIRRIYGRDDNDEKIEFFKHDPIEIYDKSNDRWMNGIFLGQYENDECLVEISSQNDFNRKIITVENKDIRYVTKTIKNENEKHQNHQFKKQQNENENHKNDENKNDENNETKKQERGNKVESYDIKKHKMKLRHYGQWHNKCSSECTASRCKCNSCGKLPGGTNCGYIGMNGHWTCCLIEDENIKYCNTTHTGFWHMKCFDKRCSEKSCYCGSCGAGCTYNGSNAHWSCCNHEDFKSNCSLTQNNNKQKKPSNSRSSVSSKSKKTNSCIIQ